MGQETRARRWTSTFERLPEEKRIRVLEAAKRAFAASGFAGANVNHIAEEAGISVGSMYKYFRTKEDLFLALIEEFHGFIATTIDDVLEREATFSGRVEALLSAAVETSLADPDAVSLYIACTTAEFTTLASRLSGSIEEVSAERYRAMVAEAQRRGEVDPSLDVGWAAFFLDDSILLAQFSVGSAYYRERLRLYLGGAPRRFAPSSAEGTALAEPRASSEIEGWQPEELVRQLHALILRSLGLKA